MIVSPGRSARPFEHRAADETKRRPSHCPFCPGNEHLLAPLIEEWPSREEPGWSQRAIFNLYPALEEDARGSTQAGARPGRGRHEVIIDSPHHDGDLADMDLVQLERLLSVYQQTYRRLAREPGTRFVSLFRNRGREAGASLRHPHSQVLALDMIPPQVACRREWLQSCENESRACTMCAHLAETVAAGERLVEERADYVTFVPFAPEQPMEQLIVPRRHAPSFADATPAELRDLAAALGGALRRLDQLLGRPPCNFSFESALPQEENTQFLHWHLRVVPRLTRPGGFERSCGMAIVPSTPEDDAVCLRSVFAQAGI